MGKGNLDWKCCYYGTIMNVKTFDNEKTIHKIGQEENLAQTNKQFSLIHTVILFLFSQKERAELLRKLKSLALSNLGNKMLYSATTDAPNKVSETSKLENKNEPSYSDTFTQELYLSNGKMYMQIPELSFYYYQWCLGEILWISHLMLILTMTRVFRVDDAPKRKLTKSLLEGGL